MNFAAYDAPLPTSSPAGCLRVAAITTDLAPLLPCREQVALGRRRRSVSGTLACPDVSRAGPSSAKVMFRKVRSERK